MTEKMKAELIDEVDGLHQKAKSYCRSHFKRQYCNCCGLCCKRLLIPVPWYDWFRISEYLDPERFEHYKSRWLAMFEASPYNAFLYCPFLGDDNRCGIYEVRPVGCICWLSTKENCESGAHSYLSTPDFKTTVPNPGVLFDSTKWENMNMEVYAKFFMRTFQILHPHDGPNPNGLFRHMQGMTDKSFLANIILDRIKSKELFHGTGSSRNFNNVMTVYKSLFGREPTDAQCEIDKELFKDNMILLKQ